MFLRPIAAAALALCLAASPLPAEDIENPRFQLDGTTLIYDTDIKDSEGDYGINSDDIDDLLTILRGNVGIRTLQLNSGGGTVWVAEKMSDIVIDFALDTHVHGDCDSSCVTIFLGGAKRTMSRGSRIGFHQIYWSSDNIKSYYDREREDSEWETPFDFASWMYLDTQDEIYAHLKYMIARGVDPAFAIETLRNPSESMWRPYRIFLRGAGVLTE